METTLSPRVGSATLFTDPDISEALHASNMFAFATAEELLVLSSSCRVENLPTGAVILQEGDSVAELYPLLAGELLVYTHEDLGNELPLARFSEAYRFVGEQAFLAADRARYFNAPDIKLQAAMFADCAVVSGCVTCHNEHPKSPKLDWKLGDMMGATTWSYPKDKVTLDERMKINAAYRGGVVDVYEAYLAKAAKFSKPPEVGERWPKDGYYPPSKAVFVKEFERGASGGTINMLLQANSQLKPPG